MGKLSEFPKTTKPKESPLPGKIYAVRYTADDGEEMIISDEQIEGFHDGDLVGVYELVDIRRKFETHSLV